VEPGKSVVPHLEKNPEIHYILEGKGLLYIDGIPVNIHSDQLIFIPAEAIQTTYNTENTTLKFLIISQPTSSEHSTVILN
jgi:mannose-6-phosphate isomerase-like protein (cupin superfamily)